ncbi:MAG: esterase-like activity of phytase family protein [Sphingomonadaceae bacterium]
MLALVIVIIGLTPGLWWVVPAPPPSTDFDLRFEEVAKPSPEALAPHLGPFRLEHVWSLEGGHSRFGGFSALIAMGDGQLVAFSDSGNILRFTPPGRRGGPSMFAEVYREVKSDKRERDIEGATVDPETGTIWTSQEFANSVVRHRFGKDDRLIQQAHRAPPGMKDWGTNSGPESIARLTDGSFVLLREGFGYFSDARRRPAIRFASDPTGDVRGERFTVVGPREFSPTEAEQMPDGRVLVLYRRPVWVVPTRFAGRIAIGDPRGIEAGKDWQLTEVAKLTSTLPVDNFEGMAIEPREDGRLTVWLISDDNLAVMQRTLLWELSVDPADLPRTHEKAPGKPERSSVSDKD